MNNFFRILTFTFVLSIQLVFAQTSPQNLWQDVEQSQIVPVGERHIIPQVFRTLKLDVEGMQSFLSEAPLEFSDETRSKLVVLKVKLILEKESMIPMPQPVLILQFMVFML